MSAYDQLDPPFRRLADAAVGACKNGKFSVRVPEHLFNPVDQVLLEYGGNSLADAFDNLCRALLGLQRPSKAA